MSYALGDVHLALIVDRGASPGRALRAAQLWAVPGVDVVIIVLLSLERRGDSARERPRHYSHYGTFAGHRLVTSGLTSTTPHRPAHLLLGQCPLPVTFQMVALILPMAKDSESHSFSPCSGWRSCHTLRWDSTTKSTRGCEGRGGRLRLRLDSTSDSTRGFDGPRSCPTTLQGP